MKIENFQYHNKVLEWQIEALTFSDVTLLVGVSGVGKTQILQALLRLKRIAQGKSVNGAKWKVAFSTSENSHYEWQGEFESLDRMPMEEGWPFFPDEDDSTRERAAIISEDLRKDGEIVITRTADEIKLVGQKTPKLSPTSSIISLLSEEDLVKPASDGFRRIIFSDQTLGRGITALLQSQFEKFAKKYDTLEKIRESDLDTHVKLALIYKCHDAIFGEIKKRFLDIFPQVTDVRIEPREDSSAPAFLAEIPVIQIREAGVSKWIDQTKISSGMLRTIAHIAEMYLWPDGTVILIDEFENSLGINCIDVVTDDLLVHNRRLQFILTSHHPYIINNINPRYWKVVTRKGGLVSAHDAAELHIGTSSHDAFIQLINSSAYREGIQ